MYLLPALTEKPLHSVYTQHGILIVIGLFCGIASSTIVIQIFRTGIDDGTDLLVLVKPISKPIIMWVKYFVFLTYVIATSLLLTGESAFTYLSSFNEYNFSSTIVIGSAVGTLVIMMLWGGLTIIFTVFYKKFGCFLFSISAQAAILVVAVVFSVITVSPGYYLKHQKGYYFEPIALLSTPNNKGQSNYQWGYYAYKGDSTNPITEGTIFNGLKLSQYGVDISNFNQLMWNQAEKNTNRNVLNYLDLNNQLVTMYYIQTQNYFKHELNPIKILNRMDSSSGEGTFYNLKFGTENANQILNNINPLLYKNGNNQHIMLIAKSKFIVAPRNKKIEYFNNNVINGIDSKNTGEFKFDFNFKEIIVPTIVENGNKFEIVQKNATSPEELIKTLFTPDMSHAIDKINETLEKIIVSPNEIDLPSLIFTLLNSQYVKNSGDYKNFNNLIKSYLNELYIKYTQIQYWTYLMLLNYSKNPSEYSWLDKTTLNNMYYLLQNNIDNPLVKKGYSYPFLYVNNNDLLNLINNGIYDYEIRGNWGVFSPQLAISNANGLATLKLLELQNVYDISALISCWTILGLTLGLVGMTLFMKRDFS